MSLSTLKPLIGLGVLLLTTLSVDAQTSTGGFEAKLDISCGPVYRCLGEAEIKALEGKSLRYRHPRGADFGDVVLEFQQGGIVKGSNKKGAGGSGPWKMNGDSVQMDLSGWGTQTLKIFRVGTVGIFGTAPQGLFMFPIEVVDVK